MTRKILFNNLPELYKKNKKYYDLTFKNVCNNSSFILGDYTNKFENNFAKFCNTKYAIGVSSGTEAIYLALLSLKLKKNDEILIPSHTFIASILPAMKLNLKIKFIDVDKSDFNVLTEDLKKNISPKTKAIIFVHLYGLAVDIEKIKKDIPRKIKIIEDCSQAHGATVNGRKVGSLGHVGCFSLYPGKNLGAFGDGGIVVTNNKSIYDFIYLYRNWGSKKKYVHNSFGWNSRLDNLQSGMLIKKLEVLQNENKERIKLAAYYHKKLEALKNENKIYIPPHHTNYRHVYHLLVIRVKNRNKLAKYLSQKNIQTVIHYPTPGHMHKVVKNYKNKSVNKLENSEKLCREIISLPMHCNLKKYEIDIISKNLENFYY